MFVARWAVRGSCWIGREKIIDRVNAVFVFFNICTDPGRAWYVGKRYTGGTVRIISPRRFDSNTFFLATTPPPPTITEVTTFATSWPKLFWQTLNPTFSTCTLVACVYPNLIAAEVSSSVLKLASLDRGMSSWMKFKFFSLWKIK